MFSALGAKDVGTVGDKSFPDQRSVAAGALETIIVPVTILKRDKSGSTDTFQNKQDGKLIDYIITIL